MRFDLINPSDPYTFEAADLEIAAVVTILLGSGTYIAKGIGDAQGQEVPPFLLGGHDKWFRDKFGSDVSETLSRAVDTRTSDLVRSLRSVTLGSERRTSMNDIGGRALRLAADCEAKTNG